MRTTSREYTAIRLINGRGAVYRKSVMKVGTVFVSNIRLSEMIGATAKKPIGPYLVMQSRLGGIRYWKVDPMAFVKE